MEPKPFDAAATVVPVRPPAAGVAAEAETPIDRLVHDYRSSIAEAMFGISPTEARRRAVCVRCRSGVRTSAMSTPETRHYSTTGVCPACAATIARTRSTPVFR